MKKTALLDISNECNLNCDFCDWKPRDSVLTIKEWRHALEKLFNAGFNSIIFIGGEPFLRRDLLFNSIAFAYMHGAAITVHTNGALVEEEDLASLHPCYMLFSLDYFGKKHDMFRKHKGLSEKIKFFVKEYDNAYLRTTIMRDNIKDCKKMIDFSAKLGKPWFGVPLKYPKTLPNQYAKPLLKDYEPTHKQLKEVYDYALKKNARIIDVPYTHMLSKKIGFNYEGCPFGTRRLHILSDGYVTPCPFYNKYTIGHILKNDIEEMIKKSKEIPIDFEKPIQERCKNCELLGKCCKIATACPLLA